MNTERFFTISLLLDKIPAIKECVQENTSFNILDAAVKKKLRETAHSRILYRLLSFDPDILDSFLTYFFQDIIFHEPSWNLYVEKNNIDILIEGIHNVIIIENKINNAIEQPDQIDRYVKLYAGKSMKVYVIYLNQNEKQEPSPYSWHETVRLCTLKPVTYKEDIKGWLSKIMTRLKGNRMMLEALNQYYDYLDILTGEKQDKMNEKLQSQISEFLRERGLNGDNVSDLDSILNELKILTDGCNQLRYNLVWDGIKAEVNHYLHKKGPFVLQEMKDLNWDLPDAGIPFKLYGIEGDLYAVISYLQQLYIGVINLNKDEKQQNAIYEKLTTLLKDCGSTPYSTVRYPIWFRCEDNKQLIRSYCKMIDILKVESDKPNPCVESIG